MVKKSRPVSYTPYKRRRNPNGFTTDEAQTASLIVTEGGFGCKRPHGIYAYPTIDIRMCDRQALEPAERVFRTKIHPVRSRKRHCPDELFPPDGKGVWRVEATGANAERVIRRLSPLLTQWSLKKYQAIKEKCKPKKPIRPYRRKS